MTTWVKTSQVSFLSHFHCLQSTNSLLYCHLIFFSWGNPCILTRRFHLAALNSGSQPLSCSIMVFSFNQLPWPHPRSSAWGPDEIRSPCPALRFIFLHNYNFFLSDQNNSMSMQNHGQIDQPIHKCYFQFCS